MTPIIQELKCNPRRLVINTTNNTWWEIGTDGNSYATDADISVYKQILRAKKDKGLVIVRSVRYEYELKTN